MSTPFIKFAEHDFQPQPCGALYWPSENILIVSDLHFEKSSHFAMKGQFLPPYDSQETLKKLQDLIDKFNPEKLMFLGDVFHDKHGFDRLEMGSRTIFNAILMSQEIIWIDGNHDKGFAPSNIQVLDEIIISSIAFTHIATDRKEPEISGHYHPCTSLSHKGHKLRRPCFVYNNQKIIMPAFGVLTGGLNCSSPIIRKLIPHPKYALTGCDKVLSL